MKPGMFLMLVLFAPCSLLAAEHVVSFTPATNAPLIVREKAISLAGQYLGIGTSGSMPTGVTVTAEYGLATKVGKSVKS